MGVNYGTTEGIYDGIVRFIGGEHIRGGGDIANVDLDAIVAEELDVGGFSVDCRLGGEDTERCCGGGWFRAPELLPPTPLHRLTER